MLGVRVKAFQHACCVCVCLHVDAKRLAQFQRELMPQHSSSPRETCHSDPVLFWKAVIGKRVCACVPFSFFSTTRKASHIRQSRCSYVVSFESWYVDLSPQGWDPTARCRVSRGHCPELRTSEPAQSSARCDPGKWPPIGAAAGGGPTAAPDSWLLGCPANRPPGVGKEMREEGGKSVRCVLQ